MTASATHNTIAGCFALAAFTVAIIAGLAAANPAVSVLSRAIVAMLVCYPIGLMVGMIALRIVSDHVEAHEASNPLPANEGVEIEVGEDGEEEEVIVV